MTEEQKDRFRVCGSDSPDYVKNHKRIFKKKFEWVGIKVEDKVEIGDNCPITHEPVNLITTTPLAMLCKDSSNGRCAYAGDAEVVSDTERKVQCFYPVVQREGAWQPGISKSN